MENECWKKKKGLPKTGPSDEAVNACYEISLTCTEITLGVAMTSEELQTLVREETLVDTGPAVVTIDTPYDITFAEKGPCSNKIPDLEESVLDDDDLSDVDDLPALVEREFDDDNLSVDSDLSVVASKENSFLPELAAPAITSPEGEVATPLVGQDNYKLNPNTFLADSACSSHMGSCDAGMFDVKEEKCSVHIGGGKILTSTKVGKKRVTVVQKDGTMTDIVLSPFKHVPGLWVNLFALLLPLTIGWLISNVGPVLTLKKDDTAITFDRIFATKDGFLGGVDMIAKEEIANLCLQSNRAHDINFLHKLFGHCVQDTIANTAKHYNLQVKARTPLEPCPMCKIANAVQTDIPKQTSTKATKPGGRLFIDSTSVKEIGFGGYKFALGILDDYSGCTFGALLKKKSDQQQVILAFLQHLQAKGITPTNVTIFFRVDNTGENKALKAFLTANGFANVEFEFTPRNSPQFNGRIECKIAVLWTRTKSLLNTAKLPQWLRNGLWPKAFLHSILLENVINPTNKTASAYKLFHGEDYKGLNHLHIFGEVAIVKGSTKIQSK